MTDTMRTPQSQAGPINVYRDRHFVVVPVAGANFPDRCVLSGQPYRAPTYPLRLRLTSWSAHRLFRQIGIPIPAFLFNLLLMILTGGAFAIYVLLTSRSTVLYVGLDEMIRYQRRRELMLSLLAMTVGVATIVVGGSELAAGSNPYDDAIFTAQRVCLVLGGILILVGVVGWGLAMRPVLRIADYDGRHVWLRGAHAAFLESLPPLPTRR